MTDTTKEVRLRFDETLNAFAITVVRILGVDAFKSGRALRDPYGRLGYLSREALNEAKVSELARQLELALGRYAFRESLILQPVDFGFEALWMAPTRWEEVIFPDGTSVYVDVVDRRIVGQDWLTAPADEIQPTPQRLVFWSVKGGVGRSTALSVLAVHLAQTGRNVLVVDGDLEAPGLGALLLDTENQPEYGLIDFLADNGIYDWSDTELQDFVGTSLLTDRTSGQGLVEVAPAVGLATRHNPQNMLAKLSRALLEDPSENGKPISVRTQYRTFVDRLTRLRKYDAVLIDARAGLAEIAAGSLIGLGATTLVFGVNQTQTFDDYRYLFAHLARMPHSEEPQRDWRRRFRFVQAKADPKDGDTESFKDRLYEVLSEEFYEEEVDQPNPFNFSLDDPNAPHSAVAVNFDFPYMSFDPVYHPTQLKRETYRAAFAEFLTFTNRLLDIPSDER
jgi:hypothetical protein